jgi:asparagine synthase (glutamine-hydrolysing)
MFCGRALGGKTMFRNIREVEPGHWFRMDLDTGRPQIQKYWSLRHDYDRSRSDEAVTEELLHSLDESVKIHCRSDASLGCHLSGGLDSSTVVALASRHRRGLKTFSIRFAEEGFFDETHYAQAVARHAGVEYFETEPNCKQMAACLPYVMWHMDVPMATDGGFTYFMTSKLAQRHVKVSLTGHGGDELFAGYPAQFQASFGRTDMFVKQKHSHHQVFKRQISQSPIKSFLGVGVANIYRSARKRFFNSPKSLQDIWIQLHCNHWPGLSSIFEAGLMARIEGYTPIDDYLKPFLEVDTDHALDQCLYHDLRVYLPSLLHLEDRVSMAVSIESRVPFLDHRLVEFLGTVPPEQKVKGLVPKHFLRQVASKLLPEDVWARRDKCNFPIPENFWMSPEMKNLSEAVLIAPESLHRGLFKPEILKQACQYGNLTWPLMNVELWFKIFIDRDPNWTDRIALHVADRAGDGR